MGFFGQFHFNGRAWATPVDDPEPPWLTVEIHDSDIATITYEPAGPGSGIAFLGDTPRGYFDEEDASEPTDTAREAAGLAQWWALIHDEGAVGTKERELVAYLAEDSEASGGTAAPAEEELDDLDEIDEGEIFVEIKAARFIAALDLPVPDDLAG